MQKPKSTSWKSGARSLAACLLVAGLLAVSGAAATGDETLALEKTVQQYEAQDVPPLQLADALNELAQSYGFHARFAEAESLFRRALLLREKHLGPDHPDVARTLNRMADLFSDMGRYVEAEGYVLRALGILENTLGSEHPDVATSLNYLGEIYQYQALYAQAEPIYKRSLAIREKVYGPEHSDVTTSLNNLAVLYHSQGQYVEAETFFKRALLLRENALGPDHPFVATSLSNLAGLYYAQGQYAQAEPLYKRSLVIWEKAFGLEHPHVAHTLDYLADLSAIQGLYVQAEQLNKRALAIRETALGIEHPSVASSLDRIGSLYTSQGRYGEAEPFFKLSLAIREKVYDPEHPEIGESMHNLAVLYRNQGQYALAEPLYERALAINEKTYGTDHRAVATSLNNLAVMYLTQGHYAQAETLYKRALPIYEKAFGAEHPSVATYLNNIAFMYFNQGQYGQGLSMARRATSIYRQRIVAGGTSDAAVLEAFENREGFLRHLSLLSINPNQEPSDKISDEAFQIVQLEQASGTANAIAKMAVRFASGNDSLAGLVKRKQDASDRRAKMEAQLVTAASKLAEARKADDEQKLRNGIANAGKEIETIDTELVRGFPEYQELARPEPVPVGQIRASLKQGEAMLVYAFGQRSSFLWVVKSDGVDFMPLRADVKEVATKVAEVRAEMELDDFGIAPRVSVQTLHSLYQSLFAPAMPLLAGIKHVMVVPAGPLQSLPFGMLIASPPPEIRSDGDYRKIDWLAKHFAFSVLPSVSSIRALRQFSKKIGSQEPFAGFGDPLIGAANSATRGTRTKVVVASAFPGRSVKVNAPTSSLAPEIADVEAIRQTPRLPETANELRAIGKVLKANPDAILLQENANETRIKGLDLSKYRTIAFATHGMMAGEINGVGEPGLILTPPQQGTIEDDGYLSAGEIARLKLNADWVILSACNTAAADGTPGAEGLSGLAKAFFYAGARSLLVSNWYVESEAAVRITTETLKRYADNPAIGKAEALRQAMQELRDDPEFAHPLFWAPFSVVGEGGSGALVQ